MQRPGCARLGDFGEIAGIEFGAGEEQIKNAPLTLDFLPQELYSSQHNLSIGKTKPISNLADTIAIFSQRITNLFITK
jgi:hypothetical protein